PASAGHHISLHITHKPRVRGVSMVQRPTVFVVDDDPAVLDSVCLLLESADLSAQCYSCARDFLTAYRPHMPGCLVLDVRMPQTTGLELQEILTGRGLNIPIIFITGHGDVPLSVKAMKSGAVDFLEKPFDGETLVFCVQQALAKDARARRIEAQNSFVAMRFSRLTEREQEVMSLVVAGRSNKEIARKLRCSHRTVEVHRSRLMAKMEAHTLPELVSMAAVCGFDTPQAES
ncbi:MAG TPA: response regulator, partial [Gammaproteobacteria bacterium]|nr:response regulator [Gammaproteobacteria bacterium]